ncbi:MAG: hypothetical protein ACRD9R_17620 [Pyrinomonadaceae bacterium]
MALVAGSEVSEARASAQSIDTGQFMIGVLRADGALVPFAQYGNGGWWNPWPRPRQPTRSIYAASTEVIPHSLGELPEPWFRQCGKIPTTWYFWSSAGTPTALKASKVVQVENHSQTNWALLTDFPKQTSEDGHHRNIGVALNVNEKIEPMIEITTESAEGADIASFVKQTFDDAETVEFDRIRAESPPVMGEWAISAFALSGEERAKVKMSVTSLYRGKLSVSGERLYYFEAEKQYPKTAASNDRGCHDVSLFQGWISTQGKGGLGLMSNHLMLTDCDRKGPSTTTPLGMMNVKNRTFLFVREHGWEDESYIILELNDSGLHRVLETFGG